MNGRSLSIALCFGEREDSRKLTSAIEQAANERGVKVEFAVYARGEHLVLNFEKGETDLVFVGISEKDPSASFDAVRRLRARDEELPVVFVASSSAYAVKAYDIGALHYLVEPVARRDVAAVLDRCGSLVMASRRTIEVMANRSIERILASDVLYAEVFSNRAVVRLENRSLSTYLPLKRFLEMAGSSFIRCHRSYVVNMDHVKKVLRREFVMDNGECVPIRSNGRAGVVRSYEDYRAAALR